MHSAKLNVRSRKQAFHRFLGLSLVYFQRARSYLSKLLRGRLVYAKNPLLPVLLQQTPQLLGLGLVPIAV
jgi:hypothetical protein